MNEENSKSLICIPRLLLTLDIFTAPYCSLLEGHIRITSPVSRSPYMSKLQELEQLSGYESKMSCCGANEKVDAR